MSLGNRVEEDPWNEPDIKFFNFFRPIFNIFSFIGLYAILAVAIYRNELLTLLYDKKYVTVDDYTVQLRGLPVEEDFEKLYSSGHPNIGMMLKEVIESKNYKVTQINFIYETEKYLNLRKKWHRNLEDLKKKEWRNTKRQDLNEDTQELVEREFNENDEIGEKLDKMEENYDSAHPVGMTGNAFV